jgi:hypothetical protein
MMNKTSWIAAIICGIFTYIICTILKFETIRKLDGLEL